MAQSLSILHIASGLFGLMLASFCTQANAETAELLSEAFSETLRPAANTGGARVMGLQVVGADPTSELQAFIPKTWAGETFCVRTGTSDGLYDSENTYRAPMDTSEPVVVPHMAQSNHADKLAALAPHGFGIRILRAPCEEVSDATPGALALWRTLTPSGQYFLLVNSFDSDRLIAFPEGDDPVECSVIRADISVAYDRFCALPLNSGEGTVSIRLVSIKDGRKGRPEFVKFDLP